MEYDFIIIGSGFGGSVSALRLSEKGYRVAVIEQGNSVTPPDMEAADTDLRRLFWMPELGLTGYFVQRYFRHVTIVGGAGVGGGSLVYAAVLLKPKAAFYDDPAWSQLGVDWKTELAPHYETVSRMLGVTDNPGFGQQDEFLKQTAETMGAADTFGPTPNGIYFGEPGEYRDDPFFDGIGPTRMGCNFCGQCLTGCPHGAKNSLDKNYLYLAQRLGAVIVPQKKVTKIVPAENGGYHVHMRDPVKKRRTFTPLRGRKVIVAAGVLGTLELLFHCRDVARTLPDISPQLGKKTRTNSEAIVGALSNDPDLDLTEGAAISSHFYPDDHTHITQNRFPVGYTFMKWFMGPLIDSPRPFARALATLLGFVRHPVKATASWRAKNWHQRLTVLTVMQHLDNQLAFTYGRGLWTLFRRGLKSKAVVGKEAPTNLPVANRAADVLASHMNGEPFNILTESLLNMSTTAHILGGCHMGTSAEDSVIDTNHEVFGYPGLYVVDGAAVSANVGANPSLTIAALAERAMNLIPEKDNK